MFSLNAHFDNWNRKKQNERIGQKAVAISESDIKVDPWAEWKGKKVSKKERQKHTYEQWKKGKKAIFAIFPWLVNNK